MEMKPGEKFLTLMVGDMKIPFFPSETKTGKKCYRSTLTIFVNEKKGEPQVAEEQVLDV